MKYFKRTHEKDKIMKEYISKKNEIIKEWKLNKKRIMTYEFIFLLTLFIFTIYIIITWGIK